MARSMTAYARGVQMTPFGRLILEIHSVNKRVLEMNVSLPRNLLYLDLLLRDWLREKVTRGQVTVRLQFEDEDAEGVQLKKTASELKSLKKFWEKIAVDLSYDPKKEVTLSFLMKQVPQETKENIEESQLKVAFQETVLKFLAMKEREGKVLGEDISVRLQLLREHLEKVEGLAPSVAKRYLERLKQKIDEVSTPELEDRLYREMVLFADKIDITEEIVRLKSHFDQFFSYLKSKEQSIGRTLDFLCQEIYREINTIGSKAQEGQISFFVVEMKSELDKIKEQVQNIE